MEEEKKETKKDLLLKVGGEYYITIVVAFFVLQLGNLFGQYMFHKSNFIVSFILFLVVIASFLLFKELTNEKHKKASFFIVKASLMVFIFSIVNHVFIAMTDTLSQHSESKAISLFRLSYFFNFALLIGSVAFFRNESVQKTLNNVYEDDVLSKLKLGGNDKGKLKPGDVQICIDVDTKKPVILPHKDRYLHMLILGPTGSGKHFAVL